jgi:hypothetical protein
MEVFVLHPEPVPADGVQETVKFMHVKFDEQKY